MLFEREEAQYSVAEFYRKFGSNLPQVVMVTAGFHGEILNDIFDNGEVLRIRGVSRQRRVVARGLVTPDLHISIPLTFTQPLCVLDRHGKPLREDTISNIVSNNTLPLSVEFPRDQTFSMGTYNIHTNNLGGLRLSGVFDEMYLLASSLSNGVVGTDVIHVPLYLSQLRLSICTGLTGKTRVDWLNYLDKLLVTCERIKYGKHFGNPNIAVYDPNVSHTMKDHSDAYSYVEPAKYTSFFQIQNQLSRLPKPPKPTQPITRPETDVYDHIPEISVVRGHEKRQQVPQVSDRTQPVDIAKSMTPTAAASTFIAPSPGPKPAHKASNGRPEVPDRTFRPPLNVPRKVTTPNNQADKSMYSNSLPRTFVQPITEGSSQARRLDSNDRSMFTSNRTENVKMMAVSCNPKAFDIGGKHAYPLVSTHWQNHNIDREGKQSDVHPGTSEVGRKEAPAIGKMENTGDENCAIAGEVVKERGVKTISSSEDIIRLSITEVGEYLRKLRLHKYVDKFKEDLIDGAILPDLNKEILKDEFDMREIEMIRLLKFIHEGHVPR